MNATNPLDELRDRTLLKSQALVGGHWITDSTTFDALDRATGSKLASGPNLNQNDAEVAIQAAANAWPAWRRRTAKERSVILRRWCDLLIAHQEDLGRIITAEQGKAHLEARGKKFLCESRPIRHLRFTGSTSVGQIQMRQSATPVTMLSLELGGNAPFGVFDDEI